MKIPITPRKTLYRETFIVVARSADEVDMSLAKPRRDFQRFIRLISLLLPKLSRQFVFARELASKVHLMDLDSVVYLRQKYWKIKIMSDTGGNYCYMPMEIPPNTVLFNDSSKFCLLPKENVTTALNVLRACLLRYGSSLRMASLHSVRN